MAHMLAPAPMWETWVERPAPDALRSESADGRMISLLPTLTVPPFQVYKSIFEIQGKKKKMKERDLSSVGSLPHMTKNTGTGPS